eukprot:5505670-Pleurochrysis_carterae.AAC.2
MRVVAQLPSSIPLKPPLRRSPMPSLAPSDPASLPLPILPPNHPPLHSPSLLLSATANGNWPKRKMHSSCVRTRIRWQRRCSAA